MSQRERFEQQDRFQQWWKEREMDQFTFRNQAWVAWQAAEAGQQAELADRDARLAKCRELIRSIQENEIAEYVEVSILESWDEYYAAKEACGL